MPEKIYREDLSCSGKCAGKGSFFHRKIFKRYCIRERLGFWPYRVMLLIPMRFRSVMYMTEKKFIFTAPKADMASFCVIDQDQIVPEEYTTYFRSVIVFGTIRILHDEAEKREAIEKLAVKYAPDDTEENRKKAVERDWKPLCMLEMTPEHISGKEAVELVRLHTLK